jgi:hypothetical protein
MNRTRRAIGHSWPGIEETTPMIRYWSGCQPYGHSKTMQEPFVADAFDPRNRKGATPPGTTSAPVEKVAAGIAFHNAGLWQAATPGDLPRLRDDLLSPRFLPRHYWILPIVNSSLSGMLKLRGPGHSATKALISYTDTAVPRDILPGIDQAATLFERAERIRFTDQSSAGREDVDKSNEWVRADAAGTPRCRGGWAVAGFCGAQRKHPPGSPP